MRRSYRIAVIESDTLIRELVMRWLREAGHEVVLTSPDQVYVERGLDLIMLDVANPRTAMEQVRSVRAGCTAPVLVVSGRLRRSPDPSPALAEQLGASAVLPKPYSRDQLLAAIAAALANPG